MTTEARDINGQPIDPNFGPEPIDQSGPPADVAAQVVSLGLKTMSQADADALVAAVQNAITNANANGGTLQTVENIVGLVSPFLKLL